MDWREKVEMVIWLMVLVAVLGSIYNWSDKIVSTLTEWLSSIAVGIIMSGVAGTLVEAVSGSFLKTLLLPVRILGIEFSVSLFFVATIVVKFWLF